MIAVKGYAHFGGKHGASAAIKNLLAFAGVDNPQTGKPFSEALCFGIAGGIGAGYSFCPSVPRYGCGSGVWIVGRHKSYATNASWYQDFFDRIGAVSRITETSGKGKAFQNLLAELKDGRPVVVWCSRARLPFLGNPVESVDLWGHTFVVYAVDEAKGVAYGADRAATKVTLTLDELAEARNGICSYKNRTLTFHPPKAVSIETLRSAVRAGVKACAQELLDGKIKTFSLPGLEIWSKMICNASNKDGWLKVFKGGLLYCALRDVFDSIETSGTGGGLYRNLFADFLAEAADLMGDKEFASLAGVYRSLATRWTELAEAVLTSDEARLDQTKNALRKRCQLFEEKGEQAAHSIQSVGEQLRTLEAEARKSFPPEELLVQLLPTRVRDPLIALHRDETDAARRLARLVR
ncbi:MAG: DUF4872 domain-containing protein [Planctomycetes bacterium]|nr:DUF4872 domain-containing protein [Planctomycetota bacterium]